MASISKTGKNKIAYYLQEVCWRPANKGKEIRFLPLLASRQRHLLQAALDREKKLEIQEIGNYPQFLIS